MIWFRDDLSTTLGFLVNKYKTRSQAQIKNPATCSYCFLCSARCSKQTYICEDCFNDLPYSHAHCPQCRLPMTILGRLCPECCAEEKPYDYCEVGTHYTFPSRQIATNLKSNNKRYLAKLMAHTIIQKRVKLSGCTLPDLICSIPMHPQKIKLKGFNHASLIAQSCAKELNIPYARGVLEKTRLTPKQVGLSRKERLKNIKASLSLNKNVAINNKHIAIVDDVMTTGATLESAARLLKQGGAKTVEVWAFARTPKLPFNR